jgi:hypothetical protein
LDNLLHISNTCVISNGSVIRDGVQIAYAHGTDTTEVLNQLYKNFGCNYPKFYKMDNLSKLGWLCSEILVHYENEAEAIPRANLPAEKESVAVLLCNASSSLDTDLRYFETVADFPSPALFVYTLPNIVIGEICIRNGWKGENLFMVREHFDAGFLCDQVEYLMRDKKNRYCICGWVELIGNQYKAMLMLVEKSSTAESSNFTTAHINDIYNIPSTTKELQTI